MAVTSKAFAKFILGQHNGAHPVDLDTDTIKVALATSGWTPNADTHEFFSDVTNEVVGAGYTAGGATLTSKVVAYDATGKFVYLDADDVAWPGSTWTARYAVIYKSTGTAATSPLISYVDLGTDESPSGIEASVIWAAAAAGGVLKLLQL